MSWDRTMEGTNVVISKRSDSIQENEGSERRASSDPGEKHAKVPEENPTPVHGRRSAAASSTVSPDSAHAEGLRERSSIIRGIFTVIIGGMVVDLLGLYVVVVNPASSELMFSDQAAFIDNFIKTLNVVALDGGALGGVLAFGGLLLAVRAIEVRKDDLSKRGTSFRILARSEFRNYIQFLGVMGASAAPPLGILWIVLNNSAPVWSRSNFGIAVQILAIWLVLILALPEDPNNLDEIRDDWAIRHIRYKQILLVRQFDGRWGRKFCRSLDQKRSIFRAIARLSVRLLILSATVCLALVTTYAVIEPETLAPHWRLRIPILFAIMVTLSVLVNFGLGAVLGRLAIGSGYRGSKTSRRILAGLAYLIPGGLFLMFFWSSIGSPESWPWTIAMGLCWIIQAMSISAILTFSADRRWYCKIAGFVADPLRDLLFFMAENQNRDLQSRFDQRIGRMSPRARRLIKREMRRWAK